MCGIVGVISWSEDHRVTRADLKRMTDAIAHRGPDGEGFYFNIDPDDRSQTISPENPQVAFGFRRLAVLDPDPRSMQPFLSTDGRYVMVFNGEIYNFRELREELTRFDPSYEWRTQGDTEVLLKSYQHWGEDCLQKLNGMFALAIWDHEKKSLFLARDRMGQKPLYYRWFSADSVSFASEALAASRTIPLLGRQVEHYLAYGYLDLDGDAWEQPVQVPPGKTWLISKGVEERLDAGGSTFFNPASGRGTSASLVAGAQPPNHERGAHATIKHAVERAVERQLVSDVPLGVFLSGGVDSSVIALCARKHGPVKTFSIAFDDPRYDESPYAREVAKHLGTDHHEFRVTPNVIEDLPKLARVFGEPFADSSAIPTHYLCRETRKHVTVALSGDGGDELFGGYDRYVAMQKAQSIPRWLGVLLTPLARPFTSGHPKSRLTRGARFVSALSLAPSRRYDAFMRIFDDDLLSALLGSDQRRRRSVVEETFEREFARTSNVVTSALATDRVTYLPNDLLTKVDRCSMLHSLEVRSPFMDHELVELAAQLTEDQLLKGGKKRMLREAFASELPESVFKRPKMGFAVPIGEWFRGPLRAFLRDNLFASDSFAKSHFQMKAVERLVDEHESQRRDHSQRLYALLMLEMWWKYCVKESRAVSVDHS
jgi:asparagine synthase (glutamine-hydrolysing)